MCMTIGAILKNAAQRGSGHRGAQTGGQFPVFYFSTDKAAQGAQTRYGLHPELGCGIQKT